jgi:YfiH family protein
MALHPDWIVPDWPVPPTVRAVFTSRHGGVSPPPFDSFNLGDHVRDAPAAVAHNRAQLAECMGQRPVFLQQVHGTDVALIDAHTPDGVSADACLSSAPGVACTIMVADCLPLLFAHTSGAVVAAAHAGWRGLAQGVLENTWAAWVLAVQRADPAAPPARVAQDTLVWLGPCIGPQAFEVGPEVRDIFVAQQAAAQSAFIAARDGKWLADLPALARLRLAALGVEQVFGNDGSAPWCTVSQASRFFSHRRDAARFGSTGRMAACIWRV